MSLSRSACAVLLALLLLPALSSGQEAAGASVLPVPTPAELAALPAPLREQQQVALKAVWLERLIRAREERHRISRENLSHCALLAQKMGAPAAFVALLRRQALGNASAQQRHALERNQQDLLAAYGVDARELRFFVEGCGLEPAALREVLAWLPLAPLFNLSAPAAGLPPLSAEAVERAAADFVAAFSELAPLCQGAVDAATADAAAEALLPVLLRYLQALEVLLAAPDEWRDAALSRYNHQAAPVQYACSRERARLKEAAWYGSARLQVLDYLLH